MFWDRSWLKDRLTVNNPTVKQHSMACVRYIVCDWRWEGDSALVCSLHSAASSCKAVTGMHQLVTRPLLIGMDPGLGDAYLCALLWYKVLFSLISGKKLLQPQGFKSLCLCIALINIWEH